MAPSGADAEADDVADAESGSQSGDGAAPQEVLAAMHEQRRKLPKLDTFVAKRDFAGAIALLEFAQNTSAQVTAQSSLWLAYCAFHSGDYERARQVSVARSRSFTFHPPREKPPPHISAVHDPTEGARSG